MNSPDSPAPEPLASSTLASSTSEPRPTSSFAPVPAETVSPVPTRSTWNELIAPEPARAVAATNPLLAMLLGAVLSCALLGTGILIGRGGIAKTGATGTSGGVNEASGNAIISAVKEVGPSVMNVDTDFGKADTKDFLPTPGEQPREGKGAGTGFIIDSKRGLMLTNAHVVAGAKDIQVTTSSGRKIKGRVLGYDRQSDVAVVTVADKTLPQAKLAGFQSAKTLDIGQWTIAIGNPFKQENTVTVGVLSAVGREIPVPGDENGKPFKLKDMMQTDTAINPGNSGGPLCNVRGEVIGINTAILGIGQGLGYTIPINKAKNIADQLIKKGRVDHPFIGAATVDVSASLKKDYGLPDTNGALVRGVEPESPAAKAGVEVGDVIRKIDGKTVKNDAAMRELIESKKIGAGITVEVLRNNAVKKSFKMKVAQRPD